MKCKLVFIPFPVSRCAQKGFFVASFQLYKINDQELLVLTKSNPAAFFYLIKPTIRKTTQLIIFLCMNLNSKALILCCLLHTSFLSLADMLTKCSDGHYFYWVWRWNFPVAIFYSLKFGLLKHLLIFWFHIISFPMSSYSMVEKILQKTQMENDHNSNVFFFWQKNN